MSKLPITRIRASVPQAEDDRLEVIEAREGAQGFGAFCNFRYSYTEVSAFGGKAQCCTPVSSSNTTSKLTKRNRPQRRSRSLSQLSSFAS